MLFWSMGLSYLFLLCSTCVLFYRNARFGKFSSVNSIPFIISMMLHCLKNRLKIEGRPKYVQDGGRFNLKALFKMAGVSVCKER